MLLVRRWWHCRQLLMMPEVMEIDCIRRVNRLYVTSMDGWMNKSKFIWILFCSLIELQSNGSPIKLTIYVCSNRRANEKLANKLREQSDTIRHLQSDKKTLAEEVQSSVNKIRQLEAVNAELKTEQLKLKVCITVALLIENYSLYNC